MRVTVGTGQQQFLSAVNSLESNISQTENQISSNESFTTASENPVGAGEVNTYSQALAQSQQYATNGSSAQTNLNTEDNALGQVITQLDSLRTLALEANSGTVSASDRAGIATQMQQIQQSLLSLSNTQNGSGAYIFSGYHSQTQPFSLSATGATYAGDDGTPQAQIGADQTVATGDNGNTVFNNIPSGNGTFQVAAATQDGSSLLVGDTTATGTPAYDGATFQVQFTSATAYNIVENGATVSTGTYADGSSISYDGTQVALSGTPATGDTLTVSPSTSQGLFTTVQNLISSVTSNTSSDTTLSNSITTQINNLDQALTNVQNVQASVGGRLNNVTTATTVQTSQQTQLTTQIASLQGLNYAQAITSLEQQNTTLQAALQAYSQTQGLTLFKYIQ